MRAVAIVARRAALDVARMVSVRAVVALGYSVAVSAGAGLGFWLLISLLGLRLAATGG